MVLPMSASEFDMMGDLMVTNLAESTKRPNLSMPYGSRDPGQFRTKLYAFGLPSPVAKSQPGVAG